MLEAGSGVRGGVLGLEHRQRRRAQAFGRTLPLLGSVEKLLLPLQHRFEAGVVGVIPPQQVEQAMGGQEQQLIPQAVLVLREARLKAALKAVENSGNTMMIESLKAALEGREAKMELPPVSSGPAAFLESLKGQSAKG